MYKWLNKLVPLLASSRFFWVVVGFFVFESLWFVASAVYPMAFDEEFHLGVIKIYAEQWSPWLAAQPEGPATFGALVADPSYLYHYLMSFPYRFIALFTDSQTTQVVLLRLINVGLFAYGFVLFRQVLLRAKASPALAHLILALWALIPIAPMLAAHINYDNLLIVLFGWMCVLAFDVVGGLRRRELRVKALAMLAILAMVISVVKYAALPLVIGIALFIVGMVWRAFRGRWRSLWPAWQKGQRALSLSVKLVLAATFLLASVLFMQRYGVNTLRYHNPVPECDAVISVERCQAYGPFARNHRMHRESPTDFNSSPLYYASVWAEGMWHRMFFAVNGPASEYATRPPLPIPSWTAVVIGAAGLALVGFYWRRVFKDRTFVAFAACVVAVYVVVLWVDGYTQFLYTRWPVAVNGRYLLPILPLVALIIGRTFSVALGKRQRLKTGLAAVALLLFLQGGGFMTFVLRSDHSWNWPNRAVTSANDVARSILAPVVIEGKKFY